MTPDPINPKLWGERGGQRSGISTPISSTAWAPTGSRTALRGQRSEGRGQRSMTPDPINPNLWGERGGSKVKGGGQRSVTPTPMTSTAWGPTGSSTALGVKGQRAGVKGQGPQLLRPQPCGVKGGGVQRSVTPTPISRTALGTTGSSTALGVKGRRAGGKGQ